MYNSGGYAWALFKISNTIWSALAGVVGFRSHALCVNDFTFEAKDKLVGGSIYECN